MGILLHSLPHGRVHDVNDHGCDRGLHERALSDRALRDHDRDEHQTWLFFQYCDLQLALERLLPPDANDHDESDHGENDRDENDRDGDDDAHRGYDLHLLELNDL